MAGDSTQLPDLRKGIGLSNEVATKINGIGVEWRCFLSWYQCYFEMISGFEGQSVYIVMQAGTSRGKQQLASVDRAHKKRHHGEPELKTALKLLVHEYREQAISIRATKA